MLTDKYNEEMSQLCKKCVELSPYRTNDQLFKIYEKGMYEARLSFMKEVGCVDLDPKRLKTNCKLSEADREAMGNQFDRARHVINERERLTEENKAIVKSNEAIVRSKKAELKSLRKKVTKRDKTINKLKEKIAKQELENQELDRIKKEARAEFVERCQRLGIPVPTEEEVHQLILERQRQKAATLKKLQNPFRR